MLWPSSTRRPNRHSPPLALRRAPMPHIQQWARVRARTNCPLRRGAWYRVTRLTPLEAVLEVNQRPVRVPRPFLQVLPLRPRMWSVVPRPRDAVTLPDSWGPRYAVCPDCSARAALRGPSGGMPCPACGSVFPIAWSDSPWRVFEVLSDRPALTAMAKVRDGAAVARGARGRTTPSLDDRAATRECGAGARALGLVVCSVPELQTPVRAECRPSDDALPAVQRGVPLRAGGVVPPRRLDSGANPRPFIAARARATSRLRRPRVIIRGGEASTVSRITAPELTC